MAGHARGGRRSEILGTFTRHVAERGYDGANFSDVAAELGMSKGTIVHHFGTKDRMLAEVQERYMRTRLAEANALFARLPGAAERIAALVHAGVRYSADEPATTVAFQREVVRLVDRPGMESARALRDAYRDLVVGVLRDGEADGTFVPGDARLRSLQMFGSLHWMWTWFDPDGRLEPGAVAAEFALTLLRGLGVAETAARDAADPAGAVAAAVDGVLALRLTEPEPTSA
ncbi:TetR/AcrR family transcriptional regulator [Actinomycetospora endophytica]|uniref:TetR/AcrR family transcriptional regulator n=1 Tax=Actinomycetospora endophytica TaxID=2291215 RepID=A0ABS8P3F9_9PSEU|nr:TetR/AcrR family transcriptional regulator [Actinomycetospora endophytica]MCD2192771.1 TetR/AcrR family transcriptional regulator [Actinomycetospora endophytica]